MTATAPTDRAKPLDPKQERIVRAAVDWVYDQACSNALRELEDAVEDFIGPKLADLEKRQ